MRQLVPLGSDLRVLGLVLLLFNIKHSWTVAIIQYSFASHIDGDPFWEMSRYANVIDCTYTSLDIIDYYTPRLYGIGYKPVQHVTVPNTVGNCNTMVSIIILKRVKVKVSPYRPGVVQRVGKGMALLFHDRGTRRGWVVSSTPRPHFTPGKDTIPILQEAGWAPGPVWTGGKSRTHRDSNQDRPARSKLLYRLSYRAHIYYNIIL